MVLTKFAIILANSALLIQLSLTFKTKSFVPIHKFHVNSASLHDPSTIQPSESEHGYQLLSNNGVHKLSFQVFGKTMSFETGRIGRQASGSVVASYENTMVYSTVCSERESAPVDFTPLRVDYFSRYSAVGQTIGAFHRRDSRGDDNEILVARLIDRPIRPMIQDGWQHDTQILTWLLSYDKINPPEALSICAASAAMSVSNVPMIRPVAGVEVGIVDGVIKINPTKQEMANSTLQLTLAGTKSGILMIEGLADFLPEETMIEALSLGHQAIGIICDAIAYFQSIAGKEKKLDTLRKQPLNLLDSMDQMFGVSLTEALSISDKHLRGKAVSLVEADMTKRFVKDIAPITFSEIDTKSSIDEFDKNGIDEDDVDPDAPLVDVALDDDTTAPIDPIISGVDQVMIEDEASELTSSISSLRQKRVMAGYGYDAIDVKVATKKLLVRKLRQMILTTGKRSDGRSVEEVRPIDIDTSLLPGAHGSSLFTRGETQSLSTATLGSKSMEAKFETVDLLGAKRFYLQYRFPPSSVGEVGRVGGINRREVGHGNLAERALLPCLPDSDVFPYSIRAESLITESCGSSSMATVCGCCLAMLDAGVPLKTSVAGVAMGLILGEKEGDEPVILTDILGLEDALGTMDFKVAGNETGITSFQLDIKSEGLTLPILNKALLQAKAGRLSILNTMKNVLSTPRKIKDTVPRILEFSVPPEVLGKVIGPKGKTIQMLIETYGVTNINIEDDGSIQVESFSEEKNDKVKEAIIKISTETSGKDRDKSSRHGNATEAKDLGPPPEVGTIYSSPKHPNTKFTQKQLVEDPSSARAHNIKSQKTKHCLD
eukprot:gene9558-12871_t